MYLLNYLLCGFDYHFLYKKCIIFFLLFLGSIGYVNGQDQSYIVEVEQLFEKKGLIGQRVHYTYKDKRGIIWGITSEGLNRYNGHDVKCFKEFASPNYFITGYSIFEDADGLLWIVNVVGDEYVLNSLLMNSRTGQISNFESTINMPFLRKNIVDICQGADGKLYFSTKSKGVYSYEGRNQFSKLNWVNFDFPIKVLDVNKDGSIWATKHNVERAKDILIKMTEGRPPDFFDMDTAVTKEIVPTKLQYIKKTKVGTTLFFGTDNLVFDFIAITKEGNLSIKRFQEIAQVPFDVLKEFSIPISTNSENENVDYLFFLAGLKIYSKTGDVLYDFLKEHPQIRIPPQEWRKYLCIVNSKTFFINNNGGLLKFHFRKNLFQRLLSNMALNPNCRRILKSPNGNLMVNNDNNSLWLQNASSSFILKDKKNIIGDFFEDQHQNYWVWNGTDLNYFSTNGSLIKTVNLFPRLRPYDPNGLIIYEIDEDEIFIGGSSKQFIYSRESDRIYELEIDIPQYSDGEQLLIYDFQKDESGNVWTSSNRGLLLTDFESGRISATWKKDNQTVELPKTMVHHIYQDSANIFWLVGKNLTRWNALTNESKIYTPADGLPSSILHAVYPDKFGKLWMSTQNGISSFDIKKETFKNYFTSDGISDNEFNRISHFQDQDGSIYFGGINGVNFFNPKDFHEGNIVPAENSIIVTDYEQFLGKENKVVDLLGYLIEHNEIVLKPNDRFFNIHFTIPDYAQNGLIDYEYKIEGHDNEWVVLNENQLRINGLPYGNYNLKIKAKLSSGMYTPSVLSIPIQVLRPFYLQFWFVLLSIIIGAIAVFAFIKMRLQRLEQQKFVLEQLVEERTQIIESQKEVLEKSNAFKDRLFTIIAHDMRNAVFSFNGMTDMIKTFIRHNQPDKILGMSGAIEKSSNGLKHLLDNLLEWALNQRGESIYAPELISINTILKESLSSFYDIAQAKSITIKIDLTDELFIYADKAAVETILRNLIHNAIKFTPSTGKISLSAETNGIRNTIVVRDSGVGMSDDILSSLFDPLPNKSQRGLNGQKGSGIGLVLVKELVELNKGSIEVESIPQQGTSFYLSFPKDN